MIQSDSDGDNSADDVQVISVANDYVTVDLTEPPCDVIGSSDERAGHELYTTTNDKTIIEGEMIIIIIIIVTYS